MHPDSVVPVMAQICAELKAKATRIDNVALRLKDTRNKMIKGEPTAEEASIEMHAVPPA